jgi:hypothetical protein
MTDGTRILIASHLKFKKKILISLAALPVIQLISEVIFLVFNSPKKQQKFLRVSAIVSNMGQIKNK